MERNEWAIDMNLTLRDQKIKRKNFPRNSLIISDENMNRHTEIPSKLQVYVLKLSILNKLSYFITTRIKIRS